MADRLNSITGSPIFRIVAAQFIATVLASASCLVMSQVAALSAFLAGMVCTVPGLYLLAVSRRKVSPGDSGLGIAIRGEGGRLALSVMMFALVFVTIRPLDAVVFFATFAGLQVIGALVPLADARRLTRKNR